MKKILVCDDDSGISEVIKTILEDAGYEVQVVSNGKSILKKVKAYGPNLILLDLWMPGISGKEVIVLLKKDQSSSKIPVVIVSALSETQKIASKYGADGVLPKPFDMGQLLLIAKKYTSI